MCTINCQYNVANFCKKYKKRIHVSENMFHKDMCIHPYDFLASYYKDGNNIELLINIAKKYLNNDIAQNICAYYDKNKKLSSKQRKLLVWQVLNCQDDDPFEKREIF